MKNLPDEITEKQVAKFFRPHLQRVAITTFDCRKIKHRGMATITVEDVGKGERFLKLHGQTVPGRAGFDTVKHKLIHMRRSINCSKSNQVPDHFLLQSLRQQENDKNVAAKVQKSKSDGGRRPNPPRKFEIKSLACGQWDYVNGQLSFMSHFQEQRKGEIIFLKQVVMIELDPPAPTLPSHRLEILYLNIESFATADAGALTITFSLREAPKLYEELPSPVDENGLIAGMRGLGLQRQQQQAPKRERVSAINKAHEIVVSSCLCYRITLQNHSDAQFLQPLKRFSGMPQIIPWNSSSIIKLNFPQQLTLLNTALASHLFDHLSFEVKFQFQKLAQNGVLPPARVVELLKRTARSVNGVDDNTLVAAVRKLSNQIPFAGPHTDSSELHVDTLYTLLEQNQELIERESLYSAGLAEKYEHIALIHKATVTPVGIYLGGPEPETKNRVLRKYSAFSNYFLQVSFLDEDGESIRYSRNVSNENIYRKRFKKVLEGIILIAGRGYEVSTCWLKGEDALFQVRTHQSDSSLDSPILHFVLRRAGLWRHLLSMGSWSTPGWSSNALATSARFDRPRNARLVSVRPFRKPSARSLSPISRSG